MAAAEGSECLTGNGLWSRDLSEWLWERFGVSREHSHAHRALGEAMERHANQGFMVQLLISSRPISEGADYIAARGSTVKGALLEEVCAFTVLLERFKVQRW